jgi:hypothetical protein
MMRWRVANGWVLVLASVLGTAGAAPAPGFARQQAAGPPKNGRDVLGRMHAAYAGHWYAQIAFVQHTTMIRADGARDTATWYESIKGPNLLRIDLGAPASGRGVVYTADSTYRFQDGVRTSATADGNPFLPLIMGVYVQPLDVTQRQIAHHGIDISRMHVAHWRGRQAYVVGTSEEGDTTTSQFWVDAQRLLLVRVILSRGPGEPIADIYMDGYVRVGAGWLGTRVTFLLGGAPRQIEDYIAWSTRVPIPDALFDREQWVTEGHWAGLPRKAPEWVSRR